MLDELKASWQQIKEAVRDEYDITNVSYNTWLSPLEVYSYEDNVIRVVFTGLTNNVAINYVTKRFTMPFQYIIEELTGIHAAVEFIPEPKENSSRLFTKSTEKIDFNSINPEYSKLNSNYTFDTFVVGANNKFAHAASLSVAESPGQEYNPLFIYGGPGLGKTHLMQSIAHFILDNNPKARVLYVSSEVFTNEVIDAIRNKNGTTMTDFRNKYRNIDVLLIDDIQFIIGKEQTEEEFFNTFNVLHGSSKQIVLSSDKPPRDFTSLPERLRSRFEMGLFVDISAPDYETRMAILRKKEEMDGYTIDNEILQYIASNIKTNIRELEGALTKMYAYSKLHQNAPLTLDIAKDNLKDIISPENENKITPKMILETVAEHYGIRVDDLTSKKKNKEVVVPRQIAMYMLRQMTDLSLQDIGRLLGGKDHSTIIYGYNKVINDMKTSEPLRSTVNVLKKKLNQE